MSDDSYQVDDRIDGTNPVTNVVLISSGTVDPSQSNSASVVTAKYKQLLALARSSIQAKQEEIVEKDKMIQLLKSQLEDFKLVKYAGSRSTHCEDVSSPRQLLRRVEEHNGDKLIIWILVDYGANSNGVPIPHSWLSFDCEDDLNVYIQRYSVANSGPPLSKPPRTLSSAEVEQLNAKCDASILALAEEFRRYKVRSEISRRQREAEIREELSVIKHKSDSEVQPKILSLVSTPQKAVSECAKCSQYCQEILLLQQQLQFIGSHTRNIAVRDDASRLQTLSNFVITPRASSGEKSTDINYVNSAESLDDVGNRKSGRSQSVVHNRNNSVTAKLSGGHSARMPVDAMELSKATYARQMVYQYLTCKDIVVRGFIEDAICKLFRYNSQELSNIDARRQLELGTNSKNTHSKLKTKNDSTGDIFQSGFASLWNFSTGNSSAV
jgi:hypothetical protein